MPSPSQYRINAVCTHFFTLSVRPPVPLVFPDVFRRDALHAVDLDLDVAPPRHRVGHLVYGLLVHLHAVDGQAGACVQLLVADVALKVLRLLVLDQDLLIVELAVAVPGTSKKS